MESLRKYLKILEDVTELLTNLPDIERYEDIFYDDITCLIDKQYDKMYNRLERMEGVNLNGAIKRNGRNI